MVGQGVEGSRVLALVHTPARGQGEVRHVLGGCSVQVRGRGGVGAVGGGVGVPAVHGGLVVPGGVAVGALGGGRGGGAGGRGAAAHILVTVVHGQRLLAVDLEVLPQAGGVGVGLVAATHSAGVGLVRGVDVHVLLPVAGVGEPPVAAVNLALEGLLACDRGGVSLADRWWWVDLMYFK